MDIRVDNRVGNETSFGWFYGTHKRVTMLALKDFPRLQKYEEIFKEFVIRPDFNETGPFSSWHFYCPKTKKGSFLDITGTWNAYARYKLHVERMLLAVENRNTYRIVKHAGKALHFLQDMTQPHHTQEGAFHNKFWHSQTHFRFEQFVKENQDGFLKGIQFDSPTPNDFEDLFIKNVEFSSQLCIPVKGNQNIDWEWVGKAGVVQAAKSTRIFLATLDKLLPSHWHQGT